MTSKTQKCYIVDSFVIQFLTLSDIPTISLYTPSILVHHIDEGLPRDGFLFAFSKFDLNLSESCYLKMKYSEIV